MTSCTDKVRNAGIIEMTLCRTEKGLVPYTKGCKSIKNVNKKENYNSPCYGVKFIGIKNPKCKAGNC
jgi:myosin heavy subunit